MKNIKNKGYAAYFYDDIHLLGYLQGQFHPQMNFKNILLTPSEIFFLLMPISS